MTFSPKSSKRAIGDLNNIIIVLQVNVYRIEIKRYSRTCW